MGIFKDKKKKVDGAVPTSAPVEEESKEEIEYTENLTTPKTTEPITKQDVKVREVPVCMSQTQINNIIIDNNMILKYIVSKIEEQD